LSSGAIPFGVTPKLRPAERHRWADWLASLLERELAPSPRKFRVALRISLIGTMGAALIAICHVNNELGTYLIWLLVGAGAMMSVRKGVMLLALIGLGLIGSVVMARAFSETPWLMLPFLFAVFSWSTYIGNIVKLGAGLLLLQVVCVNVYYLVEFAPREVGWFASGAFGGCAIALGVIVAFDNWVWPQPSESLLKESLANSFGRVRSRLIRAAEFYLGGDRAERPPIPPPTSDLPGHMALLGQVVAEGVDAHRHAVLLAAITREARIALEVDRITVTARERVAEEIRGMLRTEIAAAVDAIAAALDEIAHQLPKEILVGPDNPPPLERTRARLSMDALSARVMQLRPALVVETTPAELENFASFVDSLAAITGYIERLLDEPPTTSAVALADREPQAQKVAVDPALLRYSMKVGLCVVIAYAIGIVSQRVNLSTILTTVLITALPTYGAAFRKMVLRIIGAVIGGVISLLAIIVVSPNFEALPAYLAAIFIVFYLSGYCSLTSGRVSYAGKQIGTTFALVFAGLSPSLDIYGPLWRIWGILLGSFVVALIALILWPEYAGDSLIPKLRRVIADVLALAPGGRAAGSEVEIDRANSETMSILAEMLQVADDAQLEGRASNVDHDAIVEAAGNLRRIANRFASISVAYIMTPTRELDSTTESARAAVLYEVRSQLSAWLDFFGSPEDIDSQAAQALAQVQPASRIEAPLAQFGSRIEEHEFARLNAFTVGQRSAMLAELQSLRRIAVLLPELNIWLARIPGRP
jgi:uncharacterized membrane protein YccC